jgi:hypothetical protein
MDNNAFKSIIPLKIQDIISIIKERKHFNFQNALHYLYESKLYDVLSIEDTKLWHLSSEKLFDMLENEKLTKEIIFPDYV